MKYENKRPCPHITEVKAQVEAYLNQRYPGGVPEGRLATITTGTGAQLGRSGGNRFAGIF